MHHLPPPGFVPVASRFKFDFRDSPGDRCCGYSCCTDEGTGTERHHLLVATQLASGRGRESLNQAAVPLHLSPVLKEWVLVPVVTPHASIGPGFLVCKVRAGSGRISYRLVSACSLDPHGFVAGVFQPLHPPDTCARRTYIVGAHTGWHRGLFLPASRGPFPGVLPRHRSLL